MVTPTVETGSSDTQQRFYSGYLGFNCNFPKFVSTRVKTLAALSANGFEAVYIEVVSVIMVDELSRFFSFLVSPDGNYTQ